MRIGRSFQDVVNLDLVCKMFKTLMENIWKERYACLLEEMDLKAIFPAQFSYKESTHYKMAIRAMMSAKTGHVHEIGRVEDLSKFINGLAPIALEVEPALNLVRAYAESRSVVSCDFERGGVIHKEPGEFGVRWRVQLKYEDMGLENLIPPHFRISGPEETLADRGELQRKNPHYFLYTTQWEAVRYLQKLLPSFQPLTKNFARFSDYTDEYYKEKNFPKKRK